MSPLNRNLDRAVPGLLALPGRMIAKLGSSAETQARLAALGLLARRLDRALPRGIGSCAVLLLVVATLGYGLYTGGSGGMAAGAAARLVGLSAENIVITGQVETPESAILEALGIAKTGSLVGIDADTARKRIMDLPWIERVSIRKMYPDRLLVGVAEKKPHALWQVGERLSVVDRQGRRIAPITGIDAVPERWRHLPFLVGTGAAAHAVPIIQAAARHPSIEGRVKAYIRVSNRRWDLALANQMRVKLPEHGVAQALNLLAELDAEQRLLSRQIDLIDLRQKKRVVMRLTSDAAGTRAEFVQVREKAMKKADRTL